jgi:sortase (surface protein transpeptidase)
MSMRKALFCLCLLSLLLSACGTATVSTVQKSASIVEVSPTSKASPIAKATPTDMSVKATPIANVGTPTRLIVPNIGVNASVENIGILPNGDLATPTKSPWENVGWYYQGTRPGEMGSAVIAGHLDRPGGYPAVFWYLHNLQPGNMVMVVNTIGATLRFKVTRVAAYPPNQAPLQDIFANSGGKYLNLLTCAGDWIPSEHQTTLRLVVYTTEV